MTERGWLGEILEFCHFYFLIRMLMTFYEKLMNSSFVYVSVCKLFINKKLFKINDMKKSPLK